MSTLAADLPPVRLTIEGQYWDTQIYSGELVLFGTDGSLNRCDWARFVESLQIPDELRMVAEATFTGSARFYGTEVLRLIQDPEVEPVMVRKFERLEQIIRGVVLEPPDLGKRVDNPFPFPHNDSEFHYGSLYVGARSGVFQGSPGSHRTRKLTDLPTLDVAAKHATLALAAGSEGLLQFENARHDDVQLRRVVERQCSTCEWSYASLVGSDNSRSLFVAAFSMVRQEPKNRRNQKRIRQFEGVLTSEHLFGQGDVGLPTIQWGAKDRIYQYLDGEIRVALNTSNGKTSFRRGEALHSPVQVDLDRFVAVKVAPFGSVLEFDDRLTVLLNSGRVLNFPGEPVNWRVYPRSLNYLNHLHVVYEDRVEIIAFTSDYFTPPDQRRFGTEAISRDDHFG